MSTELISPKDTFLLLQETQNEAFDKEFHTSEELDTKFAQMIRLSNLRDDQVFNVLDLGGGNGIFADHLLARFPNSTVTIIDISSFLLSKNKQSNRKELINGSIEDMSKFFAGPTFDYITVNWVLHHLVGKDYQACYENCLKTLRHCRSLLKPTGLLIIAENMFEGYLRSNLPSHLIYLITAIKWRWVVQLTKRFFNTAGVGVCFQSQRAWQRMFAEAGFDVMAFQQGLPWWWVGRSFRGMGKIHLLFVKSVSHGHFFLKPKSIS
jgi:ubiquinone/menaquinone biosynthesis C-methylase UbiE